MRQAYGILVTSFWEISSFDGLIKSAAELIQGQGGDGAKLRLNWRSGGVRQARAR
jgi:hypothetical protein